MRASQIWEPRPLTPTVVKTSTGGGCYSIHILSQLNIYGGDWVFWYAKVIDHTFWYGDDDDNDDDDFLWNDWPTSGTKP